MLQEEANEILEQARNRFPVGCCILTDCGWGRVDSHHVINRLEGGNRRVVVLVKPANRAAQRLAEVNGFWPVVHFLDEVL